MSQEEASRQSSLSLCQEALTEGLLGIRPSVARAARLIPPGFDHVVGTQGQSPYDRLSAGVQGKLVILESSESCRNSKTGRSDLCCLAAAQKPRHLQSGSNTSFLL